MQYSEEEFKQLLEGLINNLLNARYHYTLYQNLQAALSEYEREINQCGAFWQLTLRAHRETCLLNLCRVYDGNSKSLSLAEFIKIIQEHIELFDISKFRERLKDNPYVDSLAQTERLPKQEELSQEFTFVNNSDPLVKKLTILRNNTIAHTNKDWLLALREEPKPLTWDEVNQLIKRGLTIYNKYRSLFEASTYASTLIGEDDYKTVLKYYRLGTKFVKFMHEIEHELYS